MKREASLSNKPDKNSISSILNNQEAEINSKPDAYPNSLQQQQSKHTDSNQTQSSTGWSTGKLMIGIHCNQDIVISIV